MTHGDPTLLYGVLALVAIFGPLTLLSLWIKRRRVARKAREREAAIEAAIRSLPLPRALPGDMIRIRDGRVERVRLERRTPTPSRVRELDSVDPVATAMMVDAILRPAFEAKQERFEGKGGASGGAGASGDWAAPETADEIVEARDSAPDVSTEVQEP